MDLPNRTKERPPAGTDERPEVTCNTHLGEIVRSEQKNQSVRLNTEPSRPHQYELGLAHRPATEILREDLADLIEQMNASNDSHDRIELHTRIVELRKLIGS